MPDALHVRAHDVSIHRSSALQRRLKEREKEMEADERDRQREKEEIEEIRRKLLEEGDDDVDTKIARVCLSHVC